MLPLRIVVRTRTPWETMTVESFIAQKDPQTPTEFIRIGKTLIPAWEQATGLRYFEYRAKIRDLCQKALESTGLPVTVGIGGIDWDGPDEAIIPIDDDDILKPSIAEIAPKITDDINLVVWARITNYLGSERLENPAFGGQLDTCNWAVRKSFLKQWHISQREFILARHWTAAGIMAPAFGQKKDNSLLGRARASLCWNLECKLNHPSILFLEDRYSVYYLHTGSISFLAHKIGEVKDPVSYFKSLPLHPVYDAAC